MELKLNGYQTYDYFGYWKVELPPVVSLALTLKSFWKDAVQRVHPTAV